MIERQHDNREGFDSLASPLWSSERLVVDLHTKKPNQVKNLILKAISDAVLKDFTVIAIIHGFNGGKALAREVGCILSEMKESGTVLQFGVNPNNPGETVVCVR